MLRNDWLSMCANIFLRWKRKNIGTKRSNELEKSLRLQRAKPNVKSVRARPSQWILRDYEVVYASIILESLSDTGLKDTAAGKEGLSSLVPKSISPIAPFQMHR